MRAQRCCRLPARIALAAMLAAMGLAAVSVGALAADNGLTLTVHVGYQDVVKAGDWMPVTIDAKNTGAGVDGTLEVQEALNGQPGVTGLPVYHQSISLATGSSKRIRTYVTVDTTGATITARIVQNGRVIVSKDAASASTTSTMIGVLSDQATSLDGFAAVHPASVAARVVHLRADEIAEAAIPLHAFDILAIDDFATDSLTAGQRTAISDFVRSGGDLLLGTGAAWRKTLAGLPPAILPMTVSGTTSVTTALLGGSPVEVATGTQTAGPAWLSTGTQPLLLERGVGAGLVTLATFDWNQEPVAGWSGTAPLLRQLIARAVFGPGSSSQGSPYASGGMPSIAPFGGGSHTPLPLPDRNLAVIADEGNLDNCANGIQRCWMFDVREPANPVQIASFPTPAEADYCKKGAKFGPHNLHENRPGSLQSSELIFATYQNAGVRVFDIRDPFQPREVAHFVPPPPEKMVDPRPNRPRVIQSNDVYVAPDGLMYLTDVNAGLTILQYRG